MSATLIAPSGPATLDRLQRLTNTARIAGLDPGQRMDPAWLSDVARGLFEVAHDLELVSLAARRDLGGAA